MARKKVNLYQFSNKGTHAERIKHALTLLELDGMYGSFEQLAEEGIKNHITLYDFLETLLEKEVVLKEDSRTVRWIQQARFPWQKTLKEFDFAFQPSINQAFIHELASARFVKQGKNVIFLGPPGVGKTHLSIALGIEAISQGYDVRFVLLNDLIDQFLKCDGNIVRVQRLLATLLRPKVLILDDIDYYTMGEDTSEFVFKLVIQRYNNNMSMIFTSNKSFDDWGGLFVQRQRASSAIDRITERAEIVEISGTSYRLKDKVDSKKLKGKSVVVN